MSFFGLDFLKFSGPCCVFVYIKICLHFLSTLCLRFLADEDDLVDPNVEQKMMAVEGQDGQQYVVLEVIQLPENAENNVDIKPKITGVKSSPSKPKLASPVANTPKLANSEKVTKLGTYSII